MVERILEQIVAGSDSSLAVLRPPNFFHKEFFLDSNSGYFLFDPPRRHTNGQQEPILLSTHTWYDPIEYTPFELEEGVHWQGEDVVGGVVINIAQKPRLILASCEYTYNGRSTSGIGLVTYLRKIEDTDLNILVEPVLKSALGIPYPLQNDFNGRPGLLVTENGLKITVNKDRIILVQRRQHNTHTPHELFEEITKSNLRLVSALDL